MAYPQVRKDGGVHITGLENLMGLLTRLKKHGIQNANADDVWDDVRQLAGRSISSEHVKGQNDLSDLRRSLDEAKLCMAALNDVRDHLAKRIERLRNSCIPMVLKDGIDTLPDEILSHIFENGHDMSRDWEFTKCVSPVSRRFREVSLRTPRLWSRITSFYVDNQVQEFLSRSREKGLDIAVLHDSSSPRLSTFATLLRPHLNRVVSLDISDAGTTERLGLLNLPRLRVLGCQDDIDLSSWHVPLLSQICATALIDGPTAFQAQLTYVEFCFFGGVDIVSFSEAVGSMANLKKLSVTLLECSDDDAHAIDVVPRTRDFHTVHIETLNITIAHFTSRIYAARLYDALGFLFPSTVEIHLDNLVDKTPPDYLRNSAGVVFPHGKTIKIRLSSLRTPRQSWEHLLIWDKFALLPSLLATCNVAHTLDIEAPMASIMGRSTWRCDTDRKIFASLRHLQLRYCDGLRSSEVQLLADNLITGAEPGTGLQSLEILSCRNISETFLSELGAKVGPKLKWKL